MRGEAVSDPLCLSFTRHKSNSKGEGVRRKWNDGEAAERWREGKGVSVSVVEGEEGTVGEW